MPNFHLLQIIGAAFYENMLAGELTGEFQPCQFLLCTMKQEINSRIIKVEGKENRECIRKHRSRREKYG